jgi:hypothetical protein
MIIISFFRSSCAQLFIMEPECDVDVDASAFGAMADGFIHSDETAPEGVTDASEQRPCDDRRGEQPRVLTAGERDELHALLTVVVQTSPAPSNPSTRLVEEVLASLQHAGITGVKVIVVCDGHKPVEKEHWQLKRGVVTPALAKQYVDFRKRLSYASVHMPSSVMYGTDVMCLRDHHGCAHALRRALERVTTPYVLPVQHDRPFMGPVDALAVIRAMQAAPDVTCVNFKTRASRNYAGRKSGSGELPHLLFSSFLTVCKTRLLRQLDI